MNTECSIAMYHFCELNGWGHGSIHEVGQKDGVYDIHIHVRLNDVDDIKIVPDGYTIGPVYTGDYVAFEIFKDGRKLCVLYPDLPDSVA